MFSKLVQVLDYADDVDVMTLQAVIEAFLALADLARRPDLIINESKTKYMVTGQEAREGEHI